jgi:hypothetical protein
MKYECQYCDGVPGPCGPRIHRDFGHAGDERRADSRWCSCEKHEERIQPYIHTGRAGFDECILKEAGQSQIRLSFALRLLQLLPDTQIAPRDASDGERHYRSHLESARAISVNFPPTISAFCALEIFRQRLATMVSYLPSQYGMAERELSKIQRQLEETLQRLKATTDSKERHALLRHMRSLLAQAEGELKPPAEAP